MRRRDCKTLYVRSGNAEPILVRLGHMVSGVCRRIPRDQYLRKLPSWLARRPIIYR